MLSFEFLLSGIVKPVVIFSVLSTRYFPCLYTEDFGMFAGPIIGFSLIFTSIYHHQPRIIASLDTPLLGESKPKQKRVLPMHEIPEVCFLMNSFFSLDIMSSSLIALSIFPSLRNRFAILPVIVLSLLRISPLWNPISPILSAIFCGCIIQTTICQLLYYWDSMMVPNFLLISTCVLVLFVGVSQLIT